MRRPFTKAKKWKNVSWGQVWRSVMRGLPEWTLKYGGKPKPRYYFAEGGPYDGKILTLVDGTTAPIRVGNQRGRYFCGMVASRWSRPHHMMGTSVWRPAP